MVDLCIGFNVRRDVVRGMDGDELVLVGSETVRSVQVLDTFDAFLVEGFRVWCCVEIEIT
jgi:hypothetical protein